MEEKSICLLAPLLAEADTEHDINSIPTVSSVSDADTVINTNNITSSQTEGSQGEARLLDDLLTDDYCHVCEAVLLFRSQRVAHYEGKKHAQKVRMYLQARKDEKPNKDTSSSQQKTMTMDKDHFCELCSMVFSSPVVALSHYEGKVHAKNLRKQQLLGRYAPSLPPDASSTPALMPIVSDPKPSGEGNRVSQDTSASTDIDLTDPNKHCGLCAASFNNPQMALQHYNGRKHQRNQSRQQLLRELGDDHVQANCYKCPICSVELNSVEMYQAHMQGNKHQIKEKKVVDLCKSQKKVYDSFKDELADYIQVQKARGLTPKTNIDLNEEDEQNEGEQEEEAGGGNSTMADGLELISNLPPPSHPPVPPHAASFYPPAGWCPPYQSPPAFGYGGVPLAWGPGFPQRFPPPHLPGLGGPRSAAWPPARRRPRDSSSSSYTSSSSSYSSSDSSDSDYRHRERRRKRARNRKERSVREEERGGRGTRDVSEGRRGRRDDAEGEGDRRRKSGKRESKSNRHSDRHRAKRRCDEDGEEDEAKKSEKAHVVEDRDGRGEEGSTQLEKKEGWEEGQQAQPPKPRHRKEKEKKKTKGKKDTRTEEEKLWDESILGL